MGEGGGKFSPEEVVLLLISVFAHLKPSISLLLFSFMSQVVPHPLDSMSSISMGPAWAVVPVSRSVLVVAWSSQWVQIRWDTTLPTLGIKQQPLHNICLPPLPCGPLNPASKTKHKLMPLGCPASTLQNAVWSVVGPIVKGSIGDVCRVRGLQTEACSPHLGSTDQHFRAVCGSVLIVPLFLHLQGFPEAPL